MSAFFTTFSAAAGGRVVHALQGGGARDDEGRKLYVRGATWCGVEKRSRVTLAHCDRRVTCKACKRALAARKKAWRKTENRKEKT